MRPFFCRSGGAQKVKRYAVLALFILLPLAAGGIGSIATARSVGEWYTVLSKPWWNPPSWIFGPAWTLLYVLMGVAAWRVWLSAGSFGSARSALILFLLQLALNGLWSWLFFGFRMPGAALVELLLLWAFIAATIRAFSFHDYTAAWMMVPYLAWVSFAGALNAAILILNR